MRNKVHDGPKMKGTSYRVPCKPVSPGSVVPDDESESPTGPMREGAHPLEDHYDAESGAAPSPAAATSCA